MSWAMVRSADKFIRQTVQFETSSRDMLKQILTLNRGTEFARRCGLDGPNPQRVFESLPTTTYADYEPYIERLANGEQNVLCGEPVVYFSTTSGTTGPPKMIPVTRRHMRMSVGEKLKSMGLGVREGFLKPMRGPLMTIMTEHLSGRTKGGLPKGAATTGGFKELGRIADMVLSSPVEVTRVHDQTAARYLHLLFGLRHERLWTILAFFPATILFTLRDLQTHAEPLLRDLADGTINPELDLPTETRGHLLQRLRPDRDRARALTAVLENECFTVPNIWPHMGCILTATGGSFRFYADQLQPFLGDVPVFSPIYAASEATIGFGFSVNQPYYLTVPDHAYIEFLPLGQTDDPQALPIPAWQAEPGCSYEVIVTNLAGFLRYRMHDIVRVVEFHGQTPVIEFVERQGQIIDVIGEKTAEHHIVEAIEAACHAVNEPLVDYFVTPDSGQNPACYVLAIEGWQSGSNSAQLNQDFLEAVEAALRKIAPDYDEERELGTLGPMEMVLLRQGAFQRSRERRIAAGASASQIKMRHIIPDPGFIRREYIQHQIVSRIEAQAG